MSRVANQPIELPKGVDVTITGQGVKVKGSKGEFNYEVHSLVNIEQVEDDGAKVLKFKANDESKKARALSGTNRAIVNNFVVGVSEGFEKTLILIGVGYRAQVQGKVLNLTLGFSHPVKYELPEGVTAETPDNTTIVLKSIDKQKLGQAAAEVRAFRPPEPYKGKGVRYKDEHVTRKETKKK